MPKLDAIAIHTECHNAGMAAAGACTPRPMGVMQNGKLIEVVNDGVCGFASIRFPGNSGFARGMKAAGIARKSYVGGYAVSVSEFGQSYERKMAYARAYASMLRDKYGIKDAYADGRLD